MKKLSKISLKDATILDEKQLKQVYGGSGSSSTAGCSANCGTITKIIDGQKKEFPILATISCNDSCTAIDKDGAYCSDGSKKTCEDAIKN